jgi:PleD family two-component response regulator
MSGTFLDVGADSFISKPINGEAFLSEVDKLVQRVRGSKLIDKKVVIFSKNEKTSSSMHQQLATLGCATTEFTEEEKIIAVVRETDPDLFLLPINISTKIPLTLLVRILCTWALTDKQQDPSVPPSRTKRKMEIVLYEEERNLEHPWISDGEENHHAAKEKKALIQQCYNNGALGWIGTYSAETFKSNIMPYLYR